MQYYLFSGLLLSLILWHLSYRKSLQKKLNQLKEKYRKAQLRSFQMEQAKIQQSSDFRHLTLDQMAQDILHKNKFLGSINERLTPLQEKLVNGDHKRLSKVLLMLEKELQSKMRWKKFMARFKELHPYFHDYLQKNFPDLSFNDWRLIALVKLNFRTEEIADLLNISVDGVKKARYRLRKKLGVKSETNIKDFLRNVA